MLIQDKLLELARDKKGIPIVKVTIDPPHPNRRLFPTSHSIYQFWKDDKFVYGYYFMDGKWYTNTRCMDDISKMIRKMLELHFPDGKITEDAFDKEVVIRKNFSEYQESLSKDPTILNLCIYLKEYVDKFRNKIPDSLLRELTENFHTSFHVAEQLYDNIVRELGIDMPLFGSTDKLCFSKRNRITKCFSDIYSIPDCSLHDWSVRNPDTKSSQADATLPIELIQEVKDAGFECEPSGFVTDDKDPSKGYTILIVARKYEPDGEYERMEKVMTDLLVKHGFDKNAISTAKWD